MQSGINISYQLGKYQIVGNFSINLSHYYNFLNLEPSDKIARLSKKSNPEKSGLVKSIS
jgi:hypothetical protein